MLVGVVIFIIKRLFMSKDSTIHNMLLALEILRCPLAEIYKEDGSKEVIFVSYKLVPGLTYNISGNYNRYITTLNV